jgi:hypothetical protein
MENRIKKEKFRMKKDTNKKNRKQKLSVPNLKETKGKIKNQIRKT